jgi:hypothetical protein
MPGPLRIDDLYSPECVEGNLVALCLFYLLIWWIVSQPPADMR